MIDEFRRVLGYDFAGTGTNTGWKRDYVKMIQHLHVVDNNGPDRVGGGGKPLVPLAASLARAGE